MPSLLVSMMDKSIVQTLVGQRSQADRQILFKTTFLLGDSFFHP